MFFTSQIKPNKKNQLSFQSPIICDPHKIIKKTVQFTEQVFL